MAYGLGKNNRIGLANLYYSLIYNEEVLNTFVKNILKRSVYEFALMLNLPKKSDEGLFHKKESKKDNKKAKVIIDFIEHEWIKEDGN